MGRPLQRSAGHSDFGHFGRCQELDLAVLDERPEFAVREGLRLVSPDVAEHRRAARVAHAFDEPVALRPDRDPGSLAEVEAHHDSAPSASRRTWELRDNRFPNSMATT